MSFQNQPKIPINIYFSQDFRRKFEIWLIFIQNSLNPAFVINRIVTQMKCYWYFFGINGTKKLISILQYQNYKNQRLYNKILGGGNHPHRRVTKNGSGRRGLTYFRILTLSPQTTYIGTDEIPISRFCSNTTSKRKQTCDTDYRQ